MAGLRPTVVSASRFWLLRKAKIYVIVGLWGQFLTQHRSKRRPLERLVPFLNNFIINHPTSSS